LNHFFLAKVVDFFGAAIQREMCAEECGELIVALNHHKRGRIDNTAVCVEIADVLIMVHQMALIFGEREVDRQVKFKLEKIKKLMESRTLENMMALAKLKAFTEKQDID